MTEARPYILHVLSPLHAGVGQAAELIDLPIARMKGTGIPFVPGSSIKGVLRDAREQPIRDAKNSQTRTAAEQERIAREESKIKAVFGPDTANAGEHAGALICGDARLLALPVRSYRGTFAYVTSPLLLRLARRDIDGAPAVPSVTQGQVMVEGDTLTHVAPGASARRVYLEDINLDVVGPSPEFAPWVTKLAPVFGPDQRDRDVFSKRLAVVDDETMTFLWEHATQVDQRIRIDPGKRTVATGALWLEESLPAETLLIGLLLAERDRSRANGNGLSPQDVLEVALPINTTPTLQFGGKATVGRGRCRMLAL